MSEVTVKLPPIEVVDVKPRSFTIKVKEGQETLLVYIQDIQGRPATVAGRKFDECKLGQRLVVNYDEFDWQKHGEGEPVPVGFKDLIAGDDYEVTVTGFRKDGTVRTEPHSFTWTVPSNGEKPSEPAPESVPETNDKERPFPGNTVLPAEEPKPPTLPLAPEAEKPTEKPTPATPPTAEKPASKNDNEEIAKAVQMICRLLDLTEGRLGAQVERGRECNRNVLASLEKDLRQIQYLLSTNVQKHPESTKFTPFFERIRIVENRLNSFLQWLTPPPTPPTPAPKPGPATTPNVPKPEPEKTPVRPMPVKLPTVDSALTGRVDVLEKSLGEVRTELASKASADGLRALEGQVGSLTTKVNTLETTVTTGFATNQKDLQNGIASLRQTIIDHRHNNPPPPPPPETETRTEPSPVVPPTTPKPAKSEMGWLNGLLIGAGAVALLALLLFSSGLAAHLLGWILGSKGSTPAMVPVMTLPYQQQATAVPAITPPPPAQPPPVLTDEEIATKLVAIQEAQKNFLAREGAVQPQPSATTVPAGINVSGHSNVVAGGNITVNYGVTNTIVVTNTVIVTPPSPAPPMVTPPPAPADTAPTGGTTGLSDRTQKIVQFPSEWSPTPRKGRVMEVDHFGPGTGFTSLY